MDERIHRHAAVLVDWSVRIETGNDVVVSVGEEAHDLAVAVADALGKRGANVVTTYAFEEARRTYLRTHDGGFELPEHELALYGVANSVLFLGGTRNTAAIADVPTETQQAYGRATSEVEGACMDTDWVSTVHPTRATTQQTGMSFETYADSIYNATPRDRSELTEEMANMKDVLGVGSEVRIVKADTDSAISIEGRAAVNSATPVAYDSHSLPSDEVLAVPVEDAVESEVFFDMPTTLENQRVESVHLTSEGSEVVDFSADAGEDALVGVLDTDEGAHRLGELGIGMNRGIDHFTDSTLFDGRMGDTVRLAIDRAYSAYLPEGKDGNQSAVRTDMMTGMNEDSRTEVDGEVAQRNGTFRWEDGF